MLRYRCYFFEKDGAPASWRAFTSTSEKGARDRALGLLVGHPQAARVELWEQSRLAFSYSKAAAQTPAELRRLCELALEAATKEDEPAMRRRIVSGAAWLAQEAEALERRTSLDSARASRTSAGGFENGESLTERRRLTDSDGAPATGLETASPS